MTRSWTAEQEEWLRREYPRDNCRSLSRRFEEEFCRPASQAALHQKAHKMGLRRGAASVPGHAVRRVRWCEEPEMQAWMEAHDLGQSTSVLSAEFAGEFGFPLSQGQVSLWRSANGRATRRTGSRNTRARPVGAERVSQGYVIVKVAPETRVPQSKDNWAYKHVLAWEAANGPLPAGHVVMFGDHDRRNFDPGNLVAVPKRLVARLNAPSTPSWEDADGLRAAIAWCELNTAICEAEAATPRACGVCGREFVPERPGASRESAYRLVQTCPECLAAGRRSKGTHPVKFVARCAVCGREFGAERKGQRRCRECIAAKPKHGPDQHAKIAANAAGRGTR